MKKRLMAIGLVAMLGFLVNVPNVFAANPYDIVYSGGEELGADNVNINEALVNELTPLIDWSSPENYSITVSNSDEWQEGYISSDNGKTCNKVKYFRVYDSFSLSNLSFSISNNKYTSTITFDKIVVDDADGVLGDGDYFAVSVNQKTGTLSVGYLVRKMSGNSTCSTYIDGHTKLLPAEGDSEVFLETTIKLYNSQTKKIFASNELYFGIVDFDFAQSFKILNSGDEFSPDNMYAKSAKSLQPTSPSSTLRNMFVPSGHYIYSQYDPATGDRFDTIDLSNIYVTISLDTQREGLRLVYGYGGYAGSRLGYYAKQYTITYASDDGGEISGAKTEEVISGLNPMGTRQISNEGYEFVSWTADKDVTLEDGTDIKAGEGIADSQIAQIIVSEDLKLTAIHKIVPAAPNTGAHTGNMNMATASVSTLGVLSLTSVVTLLSKTIRKKTFFKK